MTKISKNPCVTAFFVLFLNLTSNEKGNEKEKKLKLERLQNMAEEKELRKMNRTELIEIIYALKKEEEEVNM